MVGFLAKILFFFENHLSDGLFLLLFFDEKPIFDCVNMLVSCFSINKVDKRPLFSFFSGKPCSARPDCGVGGCVRGILPSRAYARIRRFFDFCLHLFTYVS